MGHQYPLGVKELLVCCSSLVPTLNFLALFFIFGLLLLAINLLRHLINLLAVKFGTNSKDTSLLTLHENNRMYAFKSFLIFEENIGHA